MPLLPFPPRHIEVGRWGEQFAYHALVAELGADSEVVWVNSTFEVGLPYDIRVSGPRFPEDVFVEVKTCLVRESSVTITLSPSEQQFGAANVASFWVAVVLYDHHGRRSVKLSQSYGRLLRDRLLPLCVAVPLEDTQPGDAAAAALVPSYSTV